MTNLYTKNGSFPEPLPHRIVLSDGRTRTDPSTFAEDEILDAGYTLVTEPKPSQEAWQILKWSENHWIVEDRDLEEMKAEKRKFIEIHKNRQIASLKRAYLSTGKVVPVDTREGTMDMQNLTSVVQKATIKQIRNETEILYFKGADNIIYQLTPDEAIQMGENIFNHIEQIYQQSWIKKDQLNALATAQEVYEFEHHWPRPPDIVPDDFPVANTEPLAP